MKLFAKALLIPAAGLMSLLGNGAHAEMSPVVTCQITGNAAWVATSRGLRFTAERDFSVIELQMDANMPGRHTFDVELRRSTGFTDVVERTINGIAFNARGDIELHPYRNVVIPLGHVAVSGPESFSLRFVQTGGDGRAYFDATHEAIDCAADVVDNNMVAEPTVVGIPAGFRVLGEQDTDADGFSDVADNCVATYNPDQRDTDEDGLGNACDADLDADCQVNFLDLGLLKAAFFQSGPGLDADFDGDESVNFLDLGHMKSAFFAEPGPSNLPNTCAADTAFSSGSFSLSGTWVMELETGTTPFGTTPADVFNERQTSTEAYWTPWSGALIAAWGPEVPSKAQCAGAPLSGEKISLATQFVGDWVCVQTDEGRLARFKVTDANTLPLNTSGLFQIEYLTWD